MVESVRALVRPAVTIMLVAAFIYAALQEEQPADRLEPIAMAAFAFWFGGRDNERKPETNR